MKQKVIIAALSFTLTFFAVGQVKQAHAMAKIGSGYTIANFFSLVTTTVVSLSSEERADNLIDGYARLFHCDLMKLKYKNEFEWQKVREALNNEIDKLDKEYYRYYEFTGPVYLDKYNFKTESFPLSHESALDNVGFLRIYNIKANQKKSKFCDEFFDNRQLSYLLPIKKFLPTIFSVKLTEPLTVKSIKVGIDDAKKFVNIMAQRKETARKVYIRFRIKIMSPYNVEDKLSGDKEAVFNATLKEVDIYFDSALTMHFATIKL